MCKSPTYIINPSYNRLNWYGYTQVFVYGELVSEGRSKTPWKSKPMWILRKYADDFKGMTQKQLDENFILYNPTSHETTSLIMAAPCRKCDECLKNRYSELLSRAKFEYASDPDQELAFFTLTYATPWLPEGQNVSREDINDFRRKFSIYFNRICNKSGQYDTPRMVICSEYGPAVDKLGRQGKRRPHYHGFMYLGNYRPDSSLSPVEYFKEMNQMFDKLKTAVFRAWKRCFSVGFDMQLAKNPLKTLNYCTKYVLKQSRTTCVPEGRMPNFTSLPRGARGGLSVPYLLGKASSVLDISAIRYRVSIPFRVFDDSLGSWTIENEMVNLPNFLIDKAFPTYSRINNSIIHQKVYDYENAVRNLSILLSSKYYLGNDKSNGRKYFEELEGFEQNLAKFKDLLLPPFAKRKSLEYLKLAGHAEIVESRTFSSLCTEHQANADRHSSVFQPRDVQWTDPLGILPKNYETVQRVVECERVYRPCQDFEFTQCIDSLRSTLGHLTFVLNRATERHSIASALVSQRHHDLYMRPLRNFLAVQPDKVTNQSKLNTFFSKVDSLTDFSFELDNSNDLITNRYNNMFKNENK